MISRDALGFSVTKNMNRIMNINGQYVSIMRADKVDNHNSNLPPGIPIPVLPVDYLKNRPNFWIGGQGSYVCPIESDWALWFNWTMNKRDIAILTSVKGMNPITGQRIDGFGLEQYKSKCPVHDVQFKHGKFCSECNFKWPEQNYIADPCKFYLDGFRSSDGEVRQFYFTEDMAKSIPELVIGKEDTVPAFGFCFYSLKDKKIKFEDGKRLKNEWLTEVSGVYGGVTGLRGGADLGGSITGMTGSFGFSGSTGSKGLSTGSSIRSKHMPHSIIPGLYRKSLDIDLIHDSSKCACYSSSTCDGVDSAVPVAAAAFVVNEEKTSGGLISAFSPLEECERSIDASVGIGAGEKIRQMIEKDMRSINSWQDEPSGIIRIYFVFREQFERFVEDGLNNLTGYKESFLDSLPVGGK